MIIPGRLWRHRDEQQAAAEVQRPAAADGGERDAFRRHLRRWISIVLSVLAFLGLWIAAFP